MKRFIPIIVFIFIVGVFFLLFNSSKKPTGSNVSIIPPVSKNAEDPLSISAMRQKSYPGSDLSFEQTLNPGSNYKQYLVSYESDGLKQYGLLTIPSGQKPEGGWPVILFNHGYIPPAQYSTESSYSSFVNVFAQAGYIVFKPDYRGNANSQGNPVQIYVSPDYLTDSMNGLSSIEKYKDANPNKIGVFGHSMGGNITLHELVISKDFKAAELMAGVVGNENQIIDWWNQRIAAKSIVGNDLDASYLVEQMVADHKTPDSNPDYWNSIDPTKYIADINAPIQIQVGTADLSVPPDFSSSLKDSLQSVGKTVDYHLYPGADHNLSPDTNAALNEAVSFFNKYLK